MARLWIRLPIAALAALAADAGGIGAQGLGPSGTVTGKAPQSTTRAPAFQGPRTLFTIDGTPVHIWSPVQPSYAGSAYQNLGGQPMRSGDSLLAPGALR